MNELIEVIRKYQENIKQGVIALQKHFNTQALLRGWRTTQIQKTGKIGNKLTYDFHGIGCSITINNLDINFDFGPNNTYGGFEPWRLYSFVSQITNEYPRYVDKKVFDEDFQELIDKKIIFNPEWNQNLYYFVEDIIKPTTIT